MSEFRYHPPPASPRSSRTFVQPGRDDLAAPLASMAWPEFEFRPRKKICWGAIDAVIAPAIRNRMRCRRTKGGTICDRYVYNLSSSFRGFPTPRPAISSKARDEAAARQPGQAHREGPLRASAGSQWCAQFPMMRPGRPAPRLLGRLDAFMTTSTSPTVVSYLGRRWAMVCPPGFLFLRARRRARRLQQHRRAGARLHATVE